MKHYKRFLYTGENIPRSTAWRRRRRDIALYQGMSENNRYRSSSYRQVILFCFSTKIVRLIQFVDSIQTSQKGINSNIKSYYGDTYKKLLNESKLDYADQYTFIL